MDEVSIGAVKAALKAANQSFNEVMVTLHAARTQSDEAIRGVWAATEGSQNPLIQEGIGNVIYGTEKIQEALIQFEKAHSRFNNYIGRI